MIPIAQIRPGGHLVYSKDSNRLYIHAKLDLHKKIDLKKKIDFGGCGQIFNVQVIQKMKRHYYYILYVLFRNMSSDIETILYHSIQPQVTREGYFFMGL